MDTETKKRIVDYCTKWAEISLDADKPRTQKQDLKYFEDKDELFEKICDELGDEGSKMVFQVVSNKLDEIGKRKDNRTPDFRDVIIDQDNNVEFPEPPPPTPEPTPETQPTQETKSNSPVTQGQ